MDYGEIKNGGDIFGFVIKTKLIFNLRKKLTSHTQSVRLHVVAMLFIFTFLLLFSICCYFSYNERTGHIVHVASLKCLTLRPDYKQPTVTSCNGSDYQIWALGDQVCLVSCAPALLLGYACIQQSITNRSFSKQFLRNFSVN